MENRKRNVHLHVMVTPDELAAIHERMAEAGISNGLFSPPKQKFLH